MISLISQCDIPSQIYIFNHIYFRTIHFRANHRNKFTVKYLPIHLVTAPEVHRQAVVQVEVEAKLLECHHLFLEVLKVHRRLDPVRN